METINEIKDESLNAIQSLRTIAVQGSLKDAEEATKAILEITKRAIGHIEALASHPEEKAASSTLKHLASETQSWPILIPAIEERRQQAIKNQIPDTFGSKLNVRIEAPKRGAKRKFSPQSRTGFTYGVLCDLLTDGLFPIGADFDNLHFACMEKLNTDCMGDWENFPWPTNLKEDAVAEQHRNNPIEFMVNRWIKDGLKSLIK